MTRTTAWSFKEKAFRLSKFNDWFACLFVFACLLSFLFFGSVYVLLLFFRKARLNA